MELQNHLEETPLSTQILSEMNFVADSYFATDTHIERLYRNEYCTVFVDNDTFYVYENGDRKHLKTVGELNIHIEAKSSDKFD